MYDRQVTVEGLLAEHVAIRGQLKLVHDLTQEWDTIFTARKDILQIEERLKFVAVKRGSLEQALGYLEDGLKNHHLHEEQVLPGLVGNLLWKAIYAEHQETVERFEKINSGIINNSIEDFLREGIQTMQSIDDLWRFASLHSSREDGMLLFLKKALELKV